MIAKNKISASKEIRALKKTIKHIELTQSSLYKITKSAHKVSNLNELYISIHLIIKKLMYADNFYIALYDSSKEELHFPYYVDKEDPHYSKIIKLEKKSLTGHCLTLGIPLLYTKNEIKDLKKLGEISPVGTLSETWLGCPLKIGENSIGVIVVQSYEKTHKLTNDDRDLLNFVSELVAMVIERKRLEAYQLEYQGDLENKIRERTKELFYAKEKAESAANIKSEFLANMSHELRTPLNAILGFCEILIEDASEINQNNIVSDLQKIHKSGKDLLALINDILDLSKLEVKKMDVNVDTFILKDLMQSIVDTLMPYAKINDNILNLKIPRKKLIIKSDELKLRQILFNLISNACKYSENESININVKEGRGKLQEYLIFQIIDYGVGIRSDKLEEIFEPFSQENNSNSRIKGTGLGLAISKAYTELLGGYILVDSKLSEGSKFTAYILKDYFSKKENNKIISISNSAQVKSTNSESRSKILIIDDDIIFLDLMKNKLAKKNYRIYTANNGEKGLLKAKEILPDIIILDILMPDIDGWTVYKKLKSMTLLSEIPVIITTVGDYAKMAKDFGVTEFLSKPISWIKLSRILKKYNHYIKSKYILIIDDDSSTRQILSKMLLKDNWSVSEAENGKSALKLLKNNKPELIILDLLMPVMDGFEFLKLIKRDKIYNKIPIIVITSKDLTEDDYSFLSQNVNNIIQKGKYTGKELIKKINKIVKEHNLNNMLEGK